MVFYSFGHGIIHHSIDYFGFNHLPNQMKSEAITCNGDCNCPSTAPTPGEICNINCNTDDACKSKTLNCRSGDPCIIQCTGVSACADYTQINGNTATDVSIICDGIDACKVGIDIACGIGHCNLP
eukprot:34737_1